MKPTELLEQLADDGLHCEASSARGKLTVSPSNLITDEHRAEIRANKFELLKLLRWDDETAFELIQQGLAWCAEHYDGGDVGPLREPGDEVDRAFRDSDMFALRVSVRRYARVAGELFADQKRKPA